MRIHTISNPIGSKNNQIRSKEVLHIGKIPVVSQSKDLIDGYSNQTEKKINILPLVMFGDHTRNVKYIDFEFIIGADGTKFHQIIGCNPKYIFFWMQYAAETLRNRGYARHYSLLKEQYIPIPPLCEQGRIVDKLEELLPLFERYGNKQNSLDKLKNDFPVLLKKSILQEAVQGKLGPQDPNDEPASVLLERIRAEKEKLIKEGKIKKDKNESIIYRRDNSHYEKLNGIERCIDDEIPFEIPESWCWVRLGTVLQKLTDGAHSTPKYVESGIPFISVKDISTGKLGFANCKFITVEEHSELYKRCNPEKGDILLTKVGTTGIPVIVDTEEEFSLFVSVALLKFNQTMMYNKYLIALINSPLVQKQADENTRGVGNKNWVMRDIANTLIALPPLLEQHRIVQKLNDIFLILKNF